MIGKLVTYTLFFTCLVLSGCSQAQSSQPSNSSQQVSPEERMIEQNKAFLKQEREQINKFIKENNFTMQRTGSGLYYMPISTSEMEPKTPIKEGDKIEYNYRISLLDGTPVKNSIDNGARTILVGTDQVEIGLHEAFLLMNIGDKTMFIFPAHLAHGLAGNMDNVPPRSTLIYELEPFNKLN